MRLEVSVALIQDDLGRILIAQRDLNKSHPGLWEFPGGKIETGESPETALKREVLEEVGLKINEAHFFMLVEHDYGTKKVALHVYLINEFEGQASKCESQIAMHWVKIQDLDQYAFPDANKAICQKLLLT